MSKKYSSRKIRKIKKINKNFQKCCSCPYLSKYNILNTDYYFDKNGIKHRNIKYMCYYDMHEIKPKENVCPRGVIDV